MELGSSSQRQFCSMWWAWLGPGCKNAPAEECLNSKHRIQHRSPDRSKSVEPIERSYVGVGVGGKACCVLRVKGIFFGTVPLTQYCL